MRRTLLRVFLFVLVIAAAAVATPAAYAQQGCGCTGECVLNGGCYSCGFCIWCCTLCSAKCDLCYQIACTQGGASQKLDPIACNTKTSSTVPVPTLRVVDVHQLPART